MKQELYDLMDWARIEALVYSEEDDPHSLLGAHSTKQGVLVQAYDPQAVSMDVLVGGKAFSMEQADEGFFAVLLDRKRVPSYRLRAAYPDGSAVTSEDPYSFGPLLCEEDLDLISKGICHDLYNKLGAHPVTVNGTAGVHFAVWAPNAVRVSVVGDFNGWDGRKCPMRRLGSSGIFELFIPGLTTGTVYKYEIKSKGANIALKADPCAFAGQLRPDNASVVADISNYAWNDDAWMKERPADAGSLPMAVYQVHAGSFIRRSDGSFCSWMEIAEAAAAHIRKMGYTHIELLPVMEHPLDESCGFQVSGYYAPTARHGSPADFMAFVDYMHRNGIGVILDWPPSQFAADDFGLGCFDGTCLYEHLDPRQGINPAYGTHIFNYARPQVKNFLISSALYWAGVFHADGLRVDSLSSMLYLNYGRREGQWVANFNGGNENLDAAQFIKQLNSLMKQQYPGCLMIAEENTGYPFVTKDLADGGLGFDLKWDNGWTDDVLEYMQLDPVFRGPHHSALTFPMEYHYSENFMLALPHGEMTDGKGSMISKMPGRTAGKMANLRAALGFWITHPGKKLLFMGQDTALRKEWKPVEPLKAEEAEQPENSMLTACVKDMLKLYRTHGALYELDNDSAGFEWINNFSANENMLVFLRKTRKEEETLLVVLNFSALTYEKRKIGVPFEGKYKEIFNTDHVRYGGKGNINPRVKKARRDECDKREWSVRVTVPPLGMSIFTCTRTN